MSSIRPGLRLRPAEYRYISFPVVETIDDDDDDDDFFALIQPSKNILMKWQII